MGWQTVTDLTVFISVIKCNSTQLNWIEFNAVAVIDWIGWVRFYRSSEEDRQTGPCSLFLTVRYGTIPKHLPLDAYYSLIKDDLNGLRTSLDRYRQLFLAY